LISRGDRDNSNEGGVCDVAKLIFNDCRDKDDAAHSGTASATALETISGPDANSVDVRRRKQGSTIARRSS